MPRKEHDDDEPLQARFESLYLDHHRAVHRYAMRRTDVGTVDDVVNETFIVAWRKLDAIPHDDALPWLFAVARRVLSNQRRSAVRRHALAERIVMSTEPPQVAAEEDALADRFGPGRIRAALERLGDGDRELLMLVYWDGLDGARAARVLGRSHGSVRVALSRARRRLRRLLEDEEQVAGPRSEVSDVR